MSTQADDNTISVLSEAQVLALGGWGDVLTWLRWLREKKEFVKPIMDAFDAFTRATDWRSRLAAVGQLIDSIGAVIGTAPTRAQSAVLAMMIVEDDDGPDEAELSEFIAQELSASAADFQASAINWPGLVGKLPQLLAFLQMVAELVKRFRGPEGAIAAAVVVPPIHGLVYTPFRQAA